MIKVFKNHVCLYTVTTTLLSLLQSGIGIGANVEKNSGVPNISVTSPIPPISDIFVYQYPSTAPIDVASIYRAQNISDRYYTWIDGHEVPASFNSILSGSNSNSPLKGDGGERRDKHPPVRYRFSNENSGLKLYDGLYYICDDCTKDTIDNRSYKMTNAPHNLTAITVKGRGTEVTGENVAVSSQVLGRSFTYGVSVSKDGKIVLKNPILKNAGTALYASDGVIKVNKGIIDGSQKAVEAIEKSYVLLEDTEIKTSDGKASLLSYKNSEVWMSGGSVDFMNSHGVSSTSGGKINLENVKITGKDSENKNHAVLHTDLGGPINFKGTIKTINVHGVLSENTVATSNSILPLGDLSDNVEATEVNIESSFVTVSGNNAYGVYFKGEKSWERLANEDSSEEEKTPRRLEVVNLQRTMFSAQDYAIYSTDKTFGVVSLMESTLSSDSLLLKAEKGASVAVLAVASTTLEGGAYVDENSTAKLYLGDSSTWILQSKQKREQDESALKGISSVSLVNLISGSSIKFTPSKPNQNYMYQTLHIGKGTGEVYKAQERAHIYLNTYLNSGGGS